MIRNLTLSMLITGVGILLLECELLRQAPKKPCYGGGLILGCILFLLYGFLPIERLGAFLHVPIYLAALVTVLLVLDVSFSGALYCWTASCTIYQIVSLLDSIFTLIWPEQLAHFGLEISVNWRFVAVHLLCYGLMFALARLVLIRQMKSLGLLKMATLPVVVLSLVMLFVNQTLGLAFELYVAPDASFGLHLLEYVWNLLCCLFCLMIQFHMFQVSQREEELFCARSLISEREKQYEIGKSTMEAVNRKSHDLKYQLLELTGGKEDRGHIAEAMELVESFDALVHSGADTLDVIFSEKNQYCRENGISFVCMIDGEKLGFMDALDQYVLFGNLLDNAIQAVSQLPQEADRVIYVNVFAKKKLLMIQTENLYIGKIQFQDGLPRTSTGNEQDHGYGMTSIQMICGKYGGGMNVRAEEGVFYVNLVFPL